MIEKTLEYIEWMIEKKLKKYHWQLDLQLSHRSTSINNRDEKTYYCLIKLHYAPKEWSNGTTEWTNILEHLVKGLNRYDQPMTVLKFENFDKLADWLNTWVD